MSAEEFAAWQAFYAVEPFGGMRIDLAGGVIASTVANAHRDPKRGRPFAPRDFMPLLPREAEGGGSDDDAALARFIAHVESLKAEEPRDK